MDSWREGEGGSERVRGTEGGRQEEKKKLKT